MLRLTHVPRLFLFTVLIFVFGLPVFSQDDDTGDLVHIVISINGEAEIETLNGGLSLLTVGTLVRPDDVILLGMTDEVVVLCADLQTDQITRSSRPTNCAATITDPIWQWQGFTVIDRQRSAGYERIPYLISPRNTALLEPNPTIRWNGIANAASYDVSIFLQDGTLLWEENVTGTAMPYPERYPYLRALDEAGNVLLYDILITPLDNNGNPIASGIDPGINTPISVLEPTGNRQRIEAQLNTIETASWVQSSDEHMLAYSEALYLYNEQLYADALERLIPLMSESGSDASNISTSPTLYLLLADIFLETNLPVEALSNYTRAYEIAQDLGDIASQARALSGLGSLSSGDEANDYYTQAIDLYRALGENELADDLETRLN